MRQKAGPLATAQPPGPPTLSGWHSAASQADWLVSQGTSVWRRGCQDTLGSSDPMSPHPHPQPDGTLAETPSPFMLLNLALLPPRAFAEYLWSAAPASLATGPTHKHLCSS